MTCLFIQLFRISPTMVMRVIIPRRMEVAMIPATESIAAPSVGDEALLWFPMMMTVLLRLAPTSIVAFIPSDIIVFPSQLWYRQTDLQEMIGNRQWVNECGIFLVVHAHVSARVPWESVEGVRV